MSADPRDVIARTTWEDGERIGFVAADIILAALSAAGWVVVPREPREAMHNAARDWSARKYGIPIGLDASQGCWNAMIAAALPAAPQEDKR